MKGTKILAILGTMLVWLPILAPLVLAIAAYLSIQRFLFDYLMPAELFPAVLVGGSLLLWAALRAKSHFKLIGWGLGIATGVLVVGQALAEVTGLASGAAEPTGWRWVLVLLSLVLFWLAVMALGIGGLLLLRQLFCKTNN